MFVPVAAEMCQLVRFLALGTFSHSGYENYNVFF